MTQYHKSKTSGKKLRIGILMILAISILSLNSHADLYLNSKTGYINLNTTGQTRMQITSGGNLDLLGIANVSIPGNFSVGGNVSVDNSTLFVDAQNNRVGVGMTNPARILHVQADAGVIRTQSTTSGNNVGLEMYNSTGSEIGGVFSAEDTANMRFITAGVEKMTILKGGNVGIGTTSPSATLELQRADNGADMWINNSGTRGPHIAFFKGTNPNQIGMVGAVGKWLGNSDSNFGIMADGKGNISFFAGGSAAEHMRIDSSGSVGIGYSTIGQGYVAGKLEVDGNIALQTAINDQRGNISTGGTLQLTAADDNHRIIIRGNSSTTKDELNIIEYGDIGLHAGATSGVETNSMWIKSGGNIGIGTASPSSELVVVGTNELMNLSDTIAIFNGAQADVDFRIESDSSSNSYFHDAGRFSGAGAHGFGTAGDTNSYFKIDGPSISVSQTLERFLISNNGAITTSGTVPQVDTMALFEPNIAVSSGSVTTATTLYVASAPTEATNNYAFFVDSGTSRFDGNLGIGETEPSTDLHITDTSATPAIRIETAAAGNAELQYFQTTTQKAKIEFLDTNDNLRLDSDGDITLSAGNTDIVTVDNSGNVGIRTTNPIDDLHIGITGADSTIRVNSSNGHAYAIFDRGETNKQANIYFFDQGTQEWQIGMDDSTDDLFIQGNPNTDYVTIKNSNGNVGIGTTAPTELLVVAGNANITGTLYKGTSAYTNPDIAEMMQSPQELEEGDIVIVDPNNFNRVIKSNKKFQTAIGTVSPNATMVIGDWKGGFSGEKIAMFGRVLVKVTNESGMAKGGDLLATSSTPGHAMRCKSRKECNYEIIGVAMQNQTKANDKILMVIKR